MHHLVALDPVAPPFKELLREYMRKKKLTEPEVYKGAFISRDKFSHIINGRKGKKVKENSADKPSISQRTAMQLCIGLKLSYEEAVYFMSCAGFALSPRENVDRVVIACLKQGIRNIVEINMELQDHNFELFKEPSRQTKKKKTNASD
jgi:hypothetical protein